MTRAEADVCRFTASDGYALHYRHWRTAERVPRGRIVALHGIQSHSGWYEYSSRRLAEAGFEVFFLDRRGSGLNRCERGHAPHADRLVNDVVQFLGGLRYGGAAPAGDRRLKARVSPFSRSPKGSANWERCPIVLMGISWGGKLAAVTVARRPELVDALALLYPGICARVRPRWDQRLRLRLASRLGLEHKPVAIPLDDPALFTGQSRWKQFIRDDPLALHQATVGLLQASVDLDREAAAAAEKIRRPALLMLAGRDRIIDNGATCAWFQRLACSARETREYPNAQHTLEFEPNREQFVDDLIEWLRGRLSAARQAARR